MIVLETRPSRSLVGRLERGETVMKALLELCYAHEVNAGWISALGAFEWVELVEYDQVAKRYREPHRFDAAFEILSLVGNISRKEGQRSMHLHATVSRETPEGIEVIGGHLVDGGIFACELRIECFDELELERVPDPTTGLVLWKAPAPKPVPSGPPTPSAWGEAARASQASAARSAPRKPVYSPSASPEPVFVPPALPQRKRSVNEDDFAAEPVPEKGDYVRHAQFGLCMVLGEDEDGAMLIRLASGAHKSIRLDYLRVLPAVDEDGKRIYPLEQRKR